MPYDCTNWSGMRMTGSHVKTRAMVVIRGPGCRSTSAIAMDRNSTESRQPTSEAFSANAQRTRVQCAPSISKAHTSPGTKRSVTAAQKITAAPSR